MTGQQRMTFGCQTDNDYWNIKYTSMTVGYNSSSIPLGLNVYISL